jgi:hypothetical protein
MMGSTLLTGPKDMKEIKTLYRPGIQSNFYNVGSNAMKLKQYEVDIYYTTLCHYIVKAKDELEALTIARKVKIREHEVMNNLEPWHDADTVEECESP